MITLEAWTTRIGSWAGRFKTSSNNRAQKIYVPLWKIFDVLWGISTLLVASVVDTLLIVSGVDVNPRPPRKYMNSSSDEDVELPENFAEPSSGKYIFSAPVTPSPEYVNKEFLLALKSS